MWSDGSGSGKLAQANLVIRAEGVLEDYVHCELSNAFHVLIRGVNPLSYKGKLLTAMVFDKEIPVGSLVELVGVVVRMPGFCQTTTIVRKVGDGAVADDSGPSGHWLPDVPSQSFIDRFNAGPYGIGPFGDSEYE